MSGSENISRKKAENIEQAIAENRVFLSQISIWEMAQKAAQGKIKINQPLNIWLKENTAGLNILDIPIEVSVDANTLPGEFHKDPADRIIVATARQKGMTLVTHDGLILTYGKQGHLIVMTLL